MGLTLKCPCDDCIYRMYSETGELICLLDEAGIECKRYRRYLKLWIRINRFNHTVHGYKRNVHHLPV